jgi:hypothetical protein
MPFRIPEEAGENFVSHGNVTAMHGNAIGAPMTEKRHEGQVGGGIFLAIGPIAGLAIGTVLGQPSLGLVAGIAAGIALALFVWWRTR